MRKYTHETPFTRKYEKFEYFADDFDCAVCANYMKRGGNGCGRSVCEFQDLKDEAEKLHRIKRPRGWNKGCWE